ncbi:2Fe-2S iron-sulfur cluster-binding protein [Halioxenophilus sp. WMMB6]|uniref:2Fe-2S iron-sulfur cluster-binding protein n=1 Tax=Halioxenophilus sp. WMMB6 TaxID=3073815 RepID=UPI00295E63F2|nr:2Fe-2S iron-sulfur cluster-binding protein [Halioxenophilus sp. WMMB6]
MSTVTVTFVQQNGEEKTFSDCSVGESLMNIGRDNEVEGILGDCGGSCSCGTCHVYVADEWQAAVGAADEIEEMTIEGVAPETMQPSSRLGCQIILTEAMDGLKVTVAPAEE